MLTAYLDALRAYLGSTTSGTAFILLIGAAAFAFSLGLTALVVTLASPLRRRVARLSNQDVEKISVSAGLAELIRPLSQYLVPQQEKERSKVVRMLAHAGFRSPNALPLFFAAKAILAIALPLTVLLVSPMFPRVSSNLLLMSAGIFGGLGYLMPGIWLDHRVQGRQRQLREGFPDAMDLLVVCVEAGLGLAPALQRVADDLMISYPELGGELGLVNAEMRAGVERTQALKNLADRTGLEDIRGLVALLVQTMRFGTGVAEALRVYSEEFRDKRMQAAEEIAAKMGTKMIFPLILCFFPSFFLIAIGPAAIAMMATFRNMH